MSLATILGRLLPTLLPVSYLDGHGHTIRRGAGLGWAKRPGLATSLLFAGANRTGTHTPHGNVPFNQIHCCYLSYSTSYCLLIFHRDHWPRVVTVLQQLVQEALADPGERRGIELGVRVRTAEAIHAGACSGNDGVCVYLVDIGSAGGSRGHHGCDEADELVGAFALEAVDGRKVVFAQTMP